MADEKKETEATEMQLTESKTILKLPKPYRFEEEEYERVDLTGLEKMTVQDAVDVQKQLIERGQTAAMTTIEQTTAYACALAARASEMPIEFYQLMPRGALRALRTAVREYVSGKKETVNHIMALEKPYRFEGKTYTEVDLTGLEDLNALNEQQAENKMTVAGFVVTDTRFNFYYACIEAAMATGLPEEFFTGMPLCEAQKLKNAVNSPDFFE